MAGLANLSEVSSTLLSKGNSPSVGSASSTTSLGQLVNLSPSANALHATQQKTTFHNSSSELFLPDPSHLSELSWNHLSASTFDLT